MSESSNYHLTYFEACDKTYSNTNSVYYNKACVRGNCLEYEKVNRFLKITLLLQ